MGKYAHTLVEVFKKIYSPGKDEIIFTQEDLRRTAQLLNYDFRNFPDLNYYLRSRAKSLPQDISSKGFTTIEIRGRGVYALVKSNNEIIIPEDMPIQEHAFSAVPPEIRDLLRADEQSLLSVVKYVDLIGTFLGFPCMHLQGHLRTTGFFGQQIEADDVYVGIDQSNYRCIIPIEAKGPSEKIGLSQIKSTVNAVLMKFPNLPVIPLAVQLTNDGLILVMEFSAKVEGKDVSEVSLKNLVSYRPSIHLPNWPSPLANK